MPDRAPPADPTHLAWAHCRSPSSSPRQCRQLLSPTALQRLHHARRCCAIANPLTLCRGECSIQSASALGLPGALQALLLSCRLMRSPTWSWWSHLFSVSPGSRVLLYLRL